MERHCCDEMRRQIAWQCADHADQFECPDALVRYSDRFDEYGLIIHDGGTSVAVISFCPWCGSKLPDEAVKDFLDTRLQVIRSSQAASLVLAT